MAEEEIIKKNFKEYLEIADYSFSKGKFNAAVTLYYKALVELCDLELLRKLNKIGANHNGRFQLLKNVSPDLHNTASKLFRFYRDSYSKEMSESITSSVREEVQNAKNIVLGNKEN